MTVSRRQFLTYLGAGNYAALVAAGAAGSPPTPRRHGPPPKFFEAINPTNADSVVLPKNYTNTVVVKWGDTLGSKAPDGTPERFGFNCDFVAYFPIDALRAGSDSAEGLLWVNHEYPSPLFVSGYTLADHKENKKKTATQIAAERLSVGGSVIHVKRAAGAWNLVPGSKFNRRITAAYPEITLTGPAVALGRAVGSLANCSGGVTPWHTALSCEENYPDYNSAKEFGYRWGDDPKLAINELHYGWVMEVDPFGELPPLKHTALGRFKHENAAVTTGPTGRLVVYMGDDEADQHLYKFVSDGKDDPKAPRGDRRKLLESGTLYAADLLNGKWIPLVWNAATAAKIEKSAAYTAAKKLDPEFKIASQADMMVHARVAARGLGATPLDRCEDCEVHPLDKSVYVALTNSAGHGNLYGHILRIFEDNDSAEATTFSYEVFLAGGPQSGLACPDNLAFDRLGNLWVVCDISSARLGKGAYKPFGNNGLYVVPTAGPGLGDAYQFASGPVEAELTGPCFTPDCSTLFLSVQHPGEESETLEKLTSHWPDGGNAIPRPAVIAVTGFKW